MSRKRRRFQARPKWGSPPPSLEPHPETKAARRRDVSGLVHQDGDSFAGRMLSGRSGIARILRRLARKLERRRLRQMRPPDLPPTYTIDVK
jgi:hypothetical protein